MKSWTRASSSATSVVSLPAAVSALLLLLAPTPLLPQSHEHGAGQPGSTGAADSPAPLASAALAGQAAYATIAAIVRQLDADPDTDWSRVDVEALRQHLIDMDRVVMEAVVETSDVPSGARFDVRGVGPAAASIQRMTMAHARALEGGGQYAAVATTTDHGAILEVTALDGSVETTAKIRGLGFAGLLTIDDHHARHHRMLAAGAAAPGH